MDNEKRYPYIWDYEITNANFQDILEGRLVLGRLNRDWAACRILDYAPYEDIIRLIGYKQLVENWPNWRSGIRSKRRIRGLDFLVSWLPIKHPEVLNE